MFCLVRQPLVLVYRLGGKRMAVTANFAAVEQALAPFFGSNVKVLGASREAGGDINEAYQLSLANGSMYL